MIRTATVVVLKHAPFRTRATTCGSAARRVFALMVEGIAVSPKVQLQLNIFQGKRVKRAAAAVRRP